MHRWDILNRLISAFGFRRYLEIGIADGYCFERVWCEQKVGVDPAPTGEMPHHPNIVLQTSDDFFATYSGPPFDLVFIDGLHLADQVRRDIENSFRLLSPEGVVVCHDMNPMLEEHQVVPQLQTEWTGDAWKALCNLRAARPDLDVFTLNTDWGCAIISRRLPRPPEFGPSELTWEFLELHRKALLNLRPTDYLDHWLRAR